MRSALEDDVLARIRPGPEEHARLSDTAAELVAAVDRSGKARGMVVGSVARDTWISGDRDLDIFMLFDPSLPRETLEADGLSLGRSIAKGFGGTWREKYAEHPYINAQIRDLDVDLVPCYAVADATRIQSAVDRTPFHTRYISARIGDLTGDVLLLKQFAKCGGVYGSDQMTAGFSGYLCELLVIHYGGFSPLLSAAAGWRPGTLIDIGGHRSRDFPEPLIVVDPVDPGRNVAASLSVSQMFGFVELSRGYLESPSPLFFEPGDSHVFSREDLARVLSARGTSLHAIGFPTPPYIEDIVVPQLRKSLDAIGALLARNGFVVNRADCIMLPDRCTLLFELLNEETPDVVRHRGPPLWTRENAEKFFRKYVPPPGSLYSGPFIENGCYCVEIRRKYTNAGDLLGSPEVAGVALGKHVKPVLASGRTLDSGEACWNSGIAAFLGRFFRAASPLARIRERESRTDSP